MVRKEIEAIQKEKKSFILSGYPRTRVQGLAMQRDGLFPDAFIILNMPYHKVLQHCEYTFTYSGISSKVTKRTWIVRSLPIRPCTSRIMPATTCSMSSKSKKYIQTITLKLTVREAHEKTFSRTLPAYLNSKLKPKDPSVLLAS